ncbi:hypothetical protein POX_d05301 [Penicillium oxalicum]|uniref:hypothetical protein n=1 Tax=Penicillium oxalicum TaxID=69781 RepID=UPI0020B75BFE|nr:hypothetical protein POX_d05301 [Penicillium oxalicum]KAI2789803.1 hypothetical protein POX_d05301 [Penicillium oxalicum]
MTLSPPPDHPFEDYSPRDMTGCPSWFGHAVDDCGDDVRSAKRARIFKDETNGHKDEPSSAMPVHVRCDQSGVLGETNSQPDWKTSFASRTALERQLLDSRRACGNRKRRKRIRNSDEGGRNYIDEEESDDGDDDMPGVIRRAERDDVVFVLSREKAKRMAKAIRVPKNTKMGEEEKALYLDLATRGCFAILPSDWKKDFSTLPDSLFPSADGELDENDFAFTVHMGSNIYAIRAFHELLRVPGHVRDCRFLAVRPSDVIRKAIKKYLRWAIADAGLKKTSETKAVYAVTSQRPGEKTLLAVERAIRKIEHHAGEHHQMFKDIEHPYWPTLIGFCICGPIVTILSVDTDPDSPICNGGSQSHTKYMGQFDMSEDDQDVWNSLALAIAVIHIRRTMIRLANHYPDMPGVAHPPEEGDETEDEDL